MLNIFWSHVALGPLPTKSYNVFEHKLKLKHINLSFNTKALRHDEVEHFQGIAMKSCTPWLTKMSTLFATKALMQNSVWKGIVDSRWASNAFTLPLEGLESWLATDPSSYLGPPNIIQSTLAQWVVSLCKWLWLSLWAWRLGTLKHLVQTMLWSRVQNCAKITNRNSLQMNATRLFMWNKCSNRSLCWLW